MATILLNHFNGTDGATSFADAVAGITWVRDDAQGELDTAQKQFGVSSLRFPASASNRVVTGGDFASPHAGSWTAEFWGRTATNPASGDGFGLRLEDASGNQACVFDLFAADDQASLAIFDAFLNALTGDVDSVTINTATMYHGAVVRDKVAGTYALYFNGVRIRLVSEATDAHSFVRVRLTAIANVEFHIDEVRVSSEARYTGATYAVPTSEFTTTPNTTDPISPEFGHEVGAVQTTNNLPTAGAEFEYAVSSIDIEPLAFIVPASCEFDREIKSSYMPESAYLRSHEWDSAAIAHVPVFDHEGAELDWEGTPPSIAMIFFSNPLEAEFDGEWGKVETRYFIRGQTPPPRRMDGGRRSLNRRIDHVRRRVDVPAEV